MHGGLHNIIPINYAAPLPWPTRGNVDAYPRDYDPSQRYTRLKTGIDWFVQANFNTSAPGGWLGAGTAVMQIGPLIEQYAYISHFLARKDTPPSPWIFLGGQVQRAGGVPWQTAMNPTAALGRKSG